MELNNKTLVDWLNDAPEELYPQGHKEDHHAHYIKLKDYLRDKVHNDVTFGASLSEPTTLLNDHGLEHIKTVISRASYLVGCLNCELNPYEVYLLLCCIQLHDVGNIFGRTAHEQAAKLIMRKAEGICGRDTIEAITIKKIAETHGGKLDDENKDKIRFLKDLEHSEYGSFRPKLIASILRFADELADDRKRANHILLAERKLPIGSEVFHAYAACLYSVDVKHLDKAIELSYKIPKEFLLDKFGKEKGHEFLVDEIYNRVKKMHLERIYCSRFWKGIIDIDKIICSIEFYDSTIDDIHPPISFEISEQGYPDETRDIFLLIPTLQDADNNKLDGEYIKRKIEKL
jgi:hypothetical protein